jgi:hypothetical protein
MSSQCTILIFDKVDGIHELRAKQLSDETMYKKCGFKNSPLNFGCIYSWNATVNSKQCLLKLFGKSNGESRYENMWVKKNMDTFPFNRLNTSIFGNCIIVSYLESTSEPIPLTIEHWTSYVKSEIPTISINRKPINSVAATSTIALMGTELIEETDDDVSIDFLEEISDIASKLGYPISIETAKLISTEITQENPSSIKKTYNKLMSNELSEDPEDDFDEDDQDREFIKNDDEDNDIIDTENDDQNAITQTIQIIKTLISYLKLDITEYDALKNIGIDVEECMENTFFEFGPELEEETYDVFDLI